MGVRARQGGSQFTLERKRKKGSRLSQLQLPGDVYDHAIYGHCHAPPSPAVRAAATEVKAGSLAAINVSVYRLAATALSSSYSCSPCSSSSLGLDAAFGHYYYRRGVFWPWCGLRPRHQRNQSCKRVPYRRPARAGYRDKDIGRRCPHALSPTAGSGIVRCSRPRPAPTTRKGILDPSLNPRRTPFAGPRRDLEPLLKEVYEGSRSSDVRIHDARNAWAHTVSATDLSCWLGSCRRVVAAEE